MKDSTPTLSKICVCELKRRLKAGELTPDKQTLLELKEDKRKSVREIYQTFKKKIESEKSERNRIKHLFRYEQELWKSGLKRIAGVDEVGVGPLAGPVVSAAVVFPPSCELIPVNDSKLLTESMRESLSEKIFEQALSIGIGIASPE